MSTIVETVATVAKDHTVTVALPQAVTATRVKVTVTALEAPDTFVPFERPVGLSRGQVKMLPSFFEPMSEDDLRLWEGRADS